MTDAASAVPAPRKRKPWLLIALMLLALPGMVFFPTAVIFALLGLLPSAVAYIIDKTEDGSVFQTVFCCNLSGVLPYVAALLAKKANAAETFVLIGDPAVWLVIFGSAALGWGLIGTLPLVMRVWIEWSHQREIVTLRKHQARLREEWGDDVAHGE